MLILYSLSFAKKLVRLKHVLQFDKFLQKKPQKSGQITVCHVQKLKIVRECDGLLSMVWINTAQHSEELQFIFEEYWPVLIHTLDKRPSHSHCYQVNDCQVTYIKKTVLLKGGQYFCTVKTIRSTFY